MDNKKVTSVVQVGVLLEDFDENYKLLLIMIISITNVDHYCNHRKARLVYG